jgi:hypothetical protein
MQPAWPIPQIALLTGMHASQPHILPDAWHRVDYCGKGPRDS